MFGHHTVGVLAVNHAGGPLSGASPKYLRCTATPTIALGQRYGDAVDCGRQHARVEVVCDGGQISEARMDGLLGFPSEL